MEANLYHGHCHHYVRGSRMYRENFWRQPLLPNLQSLLTANEWTKVGAICHRGCLRISKVTELEEPPPYSRGPPPPPRSSLRELHPRELPPRELPPREPSVPASQLNHRRETKQHVVTMRQQGQALVHCRLASLGMVATRHKVMDMLQFQLKLWIVHSNCSSARVTHGPML